MSNFYSLDKDLNLVRTGRSILGILRAILRYVVATLSLAVFYYIIVSLVISSDVQKQINMENKLYEKHYEEMLERERLLADVIDNLEIKDNTIHEAIFHTQAPSLNPLEGVDYLAGVESIPDEEMVMHSAKGIERSIPVAARVESNFRKLLKITSQKSDAWPPMRIPLESLSYIQVGASIGMRMSPYYKVEGMHNGVDLVADQGSSVLAAADGVVTEVTRSRKGMGNVVVISHDGGYLTRYAHLGDINVKKGQKVTEGTKVATVGVSGSTYAPHLHYEVWRGDELFDPVDFFYGSVTPETYFNMKYMAARTSQSLD